MKNFITTSLLLFGFITMSFAQISDTEKSALIDLYKATNGDHWNSSWDLTTDVATWKGITIKNNNVTGIHLSMNNLNGEIPASIHNLKSLQQLDLSFNRLGGEIPNEITSIASIESIKLFMNQFEGELPAHIGDLKNLNELILYNNKLSGQLPESIYNLYNLKVLHLSSNTISGAISKNVGNSIN